ncbi:MAG TPA: DUF5666 domain-containing protein [Variovorax sp.]|nr:DUF5666 domain-containing protein [Variovorax sp.]
MNQPGSLLITRLWRTVAAALAMGAILVACGGGGGASVSFGSGVDTGGTGSFASGRVAGFGSIIVNNVRFEDSSASVTDDDGRSRSRDELRLGMVVEIQSGAITQGTAATLGSATASAVNIASEIKGPVQAIAGSSLTVLGQGVIVVATTLFEDGLSLQAIRVGDIVEVYGFIGANGQITATRIEREDAGTSNFKLRGFVANLNTTARTFSIGGATISYASVVPLPSLANGNFVRVRVNTVQSAGVWTATRIEVRRPFDNRGEAEIEGIVTAYPGSGTSFQVNGLPVDASGARFKDGSIANLALGARVEVEGAVLNGVLMAREVEFKDVADEGKVEVKDVIQSVNPPSGFVVRGVRFFHDFATRFKDGTAARLVPGARVEVKGSLTAGGASVHADEVDFE